MELLVIGGLIVGALYSRQQKNIRVSLVEEEEEVIVDKIESSGKTIFEKLTETNETIYLEDKIEVIEKKDITREVPIWSNIIERIDLEKVGSIITKPSIKSIPINRVNNTKRRQIGVRKRKRRRRRRKF